MLPIQKKLHGYDPAEVEAAFFALKREILSLRQKLAKTEKQIDSDHAESFVAERMELLATIRNYELQISQYKLQIDQKEQEPQLLRSHAVSPVGEGESDMQAARSIYARAFADIREMTDECKGNMSALTDEICESLCAEILDAAAIYEMLRNFKREANAFVAQGLAHFKTLEKLLEAISLPENKTQEQLRCVAESKAHIRDKLDRRAGLLAAEFLDGPSDVVSEPPMEADVIGSEQSKDNMQGTEAQGSVMQETEAQESGVFSKDIEIQLEGSDSLELLDQSEPKDKGQGDAFGAWDAVDGYDPEEELADMRETVRLQLEHEKGDAHLLGNTEGEQPV